MNKPYECKIIEELYKNQERNDISHFEVNSEHWLNIAEYNLWLMPYKDFPRKLFYRGIEIKETTEDVINVILK